MSYTTSKSTKLKGIITHSSNWYSDFVYVTAYNERSYQFYMIELPHPKGEEVLSGFDHDYKKMCEHLDIH